jgi:hypothetical protein
MNEETGTTQRGPAPDERPESDRPDETREPPDAPADAPARPTPGVKHMPEPDAENIMPAENEPGTM